MNIYGMPREYENDEIERERVDIVEFGERGAIDEESNDWRVPEASVGAKNVLGVHEATQDKQLDVVVRVHVDALAVQEAHPGRHLGGHLATVVDGRDLVDNERLQQLDERAHALVLIEIVEFELDGLDELVGRRVSTAGNVG